MPLIDLRAVGRTFEGEAGVSTQALSGISFAIEAGEFVCVTGPSGAGKSVLLNILGCLDRPTQGAYRFAGQDVTVLDADTLARMRRDEFGFVFQRFNLLDSATLRRNVELPAVYAGLRRGPARRRARELLESFGLGERLDHRPAELSGGEQQRAALARALTNDARVILADEPTGALDSVHSDEVMALLKRLAADGRTVLVVSHDPGVAALADRRIELREGAVVADSGTAAERAPPRFERATSAGRVSAPSRAFAALRDASTCLLASPLRTALTAFSIALGVWSVVAVLSLAEGVHRRSLEMLAATEITAHAFGPLKAPAIRLVPADADSIQAEISNIQRIVLRTRGGLEVGRGSVTVRALVRAETADRLIVNDNQEWPLDRGAFLTADDSEHREQVVVLGPTLRDSLFEEGVDPLGEHVQIGGVPFLVKGVLGAHPIPPGFDFGSTYQSMFGNVAYVPFHTGLELLDPGADAPGDFGSLIIDAHVADVMSVEATASAIRDLLIRRHGREGFNIEIAAARVDGFRKMRGLHPAVQAGIGTTTLLAGGMGVLILMLVSVNARQREIGIRMALGARRRDITTQFLIEAAMAAVVGGALGLLLGYWTGPLVSAVATPTGFARAPIAFAAWFVPVAVICAVATGLVAGIVPARRAARLDPVAALAAE